MKEIRIQHHPSLPSTNDALKALAADGEEEGLLLIADSQTAGKGRLQRRFFSPDGTGLYMSLLLRPSFSPTLAPHVTLAAAVAVAMVLSLAAAAVATLAETAVPMAAVAAATSGERAEHMAVTVAVLARPARLVLRLWMLWTF